jgi:hypothetical protein
MSINIIIGIRMGRERDEALTDGGGCGHMPVVCEGISGCPISVNAHSDEAKYGDCAQDNEDRDGEQTSVQIPWESNAGQDSEGDSQ